MRQKLFISTIVAITLILTISCTHTPSHERRVANTNSETSAPALSSQQSAIKDRLLALAQDKSKWPEIIGALDKLMPTLAKLSAQNKLKPVLLVVGQNLLKMNKLPERITAENLAETIDLLAAMIENQFIAKGLSEKSKHKYVSWLEASRNIEKAARETSVPSRGPNFPSALENPVFLKELELVAKAKFRPSSELRLLVDGPQSFPLRKELIKNAKKSIYVMTWAIEDDTTGREFAKLLYEKHNAGIDVRVIVDNKTAQQAIYGTVPTWLKDQGVPTIQWKDPEFPFFAFHKKALIVDGQKLIAGGMNFGDVYSHMGPEKTPKWRDTDFYVEGNAAIDSQLIFVQTWNSQVERNKLNLSKLVFNLSYIPSERQNGQLVMVVDQVPNPEVKDPILTSIIKGIEGAAREINIENAYYIKNPAMQRALTRALDRGVKVNIFTNSATSIDVPIIAKPILSSLDNLYEKNTEVYLKKGATLHSKFMTIDGVASWVMSYNHHPQSMRTQGEIAYVILDKPFSAKLATQFQTDIAMLATHVTNVKELQPEETFIDILLRHYFFDQL